MLFFATEIPIFVYSSNLNFFELKIKLIRQNLLTFTSVAIKGVEVILNIKFNELYCLSFLCIAHITIRRLISIHSVLFAFFLFLLLHSKSTVYFIFLFTLFFLFHYIDGSVCTKSIARIFLENLFSYFT